MDLSHFVHPLLCQWVFGLFAPFADCKKITVVYTGVQVTVLSILAGVYIEKRNCWLLKQWHPTPVLLPGKSHGWRSLVGCSLWGR